MKAPQHFYLLDAHMPADNRHKSSKNSWKDTLRFIANNAFPELADAAKARLKSSRES